jgi:riboflavin kinase/FMN adenylyltransferase
VYSAHGIVRGSTHRAVLNIGTRPTLNNPSPPLRVEVHLLDFNENLYGEEMEIVFGEKFRDEKKFSSVEELKAQIARDVERAKVLF